MKKVILSIFVIYFLNIPNALSANVSDYTFTYSIGAFTSIHTTGTYIAAGCTSTVFGNMPIGFTFNYNGTDYSQFGLCCSGWISLGSGIPMTSINPLSQGITNNVISPFAAQLTSNVAGDGIYYKTEGTAPDRVLIVEWWQYGFWLNGFDEICFQIKLYETTNEVRFVYTTNDEYSIRTVQVGLRGSSNTDFNNRQTTTNWTQTIAGGVNTASCTFSPGITPPAGLTFTFTPPPVGVININSQAPGTFALQQNYPNPFNPITIFRFQISKLSNVRIIVYDLQGEHVTELVNKEESAGTYEVDWNAAAYPSGVYFYSLIVGGITIDTKKMLLLK